MPHDAPFLDKIDGAIYHCVACVFSVHIASADDRAGHVPQQAPLSRRVCCVLIYYLATAVPEAPVALRTRCTNLRTQNDDDERTLGVC